MSSDFFKTSEKIKIIQRIMEESNPKVKIQTMSRAEYLQAKHIPNASPSSKIVNQATVFGNTPSKKPSRSQSPERSDVDMEESKLTVPLTNQLKGKQFVQAGNPVENQHSAVTAYKPDVQSVASTSEKKSHRDNLKDDEIEPQNKFTPPFSKSDYPDSRHKEEPLRSNSFENDIHAKCNEKIDALNKTNLDLQTQLDECIKHRESFEKRYQSLLFERDHYEQLYRKLFEHIEFSENRTDAKATMNESKLELERLIKELATAKQHENSLETENKELRRVTTSLEGQIQRMANENRTLRDKMPKTSAYRLEVQEENVTLKKQINNLQTLLAEKNKLMESKSQHISRAEGVNEEKIQILFNLVLLAAEVERLQEIVHEQKNEERVSDVYVYERDHEITALRSEVNQLQQELRFLSNRPSKGESARIEFSLQRLSVENQRLFEELQTAKEEIFGLKRAKHERYSRSREISISRGRNTETDLLALKEKNLVLERHIDVLTIENAEYQKKYYELEVRYAHLERKYRETLLYFEENSVYRSELLLNNNHVASDWNEEKSALLIKLTELRYKNMRHEESAILYMIELERLNNKIQELNAALNREKETRV